MKTQYRVRKLKSLVLNKDVYKRLFELTDPSVEDGMRLLLKEALIYKKSQNLVYPDDVAILALNRNEHIVGWATLDREDELGDWFNVNVFIDPKYRGRGIAKNLIKKIKQVASSLDESLPVISDPQDKIGQNLFKSSKVPTIQKTQTI